MSTPELPVSLEFSPQDGGEVIYSEGDNFIHFVSESRLREITDALGFSTPATSRLLNWIGNQTNPQPWWKDHNKNYGYKFPDVLLAGEAKDQESYYKISAFYDLAIYMDHVEAAIPKQDIKYSSSTSMVGVGKREICESVQDYSDYCKEAAEANETTQF